MGLFKRHRYTNYSDVPWYRTSAFNSFLTFLLLVGWLVPFFLGLVHAPPLTFLTFLCTPCLIWVSVNLATGDVYFNEYDDKGRLKTWSTWNKVLAVVVIVGVLIELVGVLLRPWIG